MGRTGTSSIIPARLILILYLFLILRPIAQPGALADWLAGRRNSIIRSRRVKVYFAKKIKSVCPSAVVLLQRQHSHQTVGASQKRCLLIDAAPVSAVYTAVYCCWTNKAEEEEEEENTNKQVVPTGLQSGESFGNQKAAGCQGNQNLGR